MAKTPLEIKSLARAHTGQALKVLAGIMNETEAPHSARVAAANSLLDRGWGKAEATLTAEVTHNYVAQLPELVKSLDTWQEQQSPTVQ
jgi:hypothetical protein